MAGLSRARAWVAGTVVVCLLLTIAAWFLLIAPTRAQAADLDVQTADTRLSNEVLAARVEQLRAQFAELPQREAELAAIRQALPQDAALAGLVRDLDAKAAESGVTLMSVTPGAGVVVLPDAATAVAPDAAAAPTGDGAAPADTAATPGATPTAPAGDMLVSLPTSVVVVGDFAAAQTFLRLVQTELARAFLVSGLTVTAETDDAEASGGKPAVKAGDVTLTATGAVFALRPADTASATALPTAGSEATGSEATGTTTTAPSAAEPTTTN